MRLCSFHRPAVLVAAALIVLAGCGTRPAEPGGGTIANRDPLPSASFVKQARVMSERWNRSALARTWRTGLVLTGGSPLIQIPDQAGFDSQRQKDMFFAGHFKLAASLPSGSPADIVRWASGATLQLPIENARAAFQAMATRTPCGGPYSCNQLGNLTVTGMRPATVPLPTSRGLAQVPAWRFSLAQLPWTFTQVAVVPRALAVLPTTVGATAGLIGVSADERTLTLAVPTGDCSGYPPPRARVETYETAGTVAIMTVLSAQPKRPPGQGCAWLAQVIKAQVRLHRPLGTRVVLDVRSGLPLPDPVQGG